MATRPAGKPKPRPAAGARPRTGREATDENGHEEEEEDEIVDVEEAGSPADSDKSSDCMYYRCSMGSCGRRYPTESGLRKHLRADHDPILTLAESSDATSAIPSGLPLEEEPVVRDADEIEDRNIAVSCQERAIDDQLTESAARENILTPTEVHKTEASPVEINVGNKGSARTAFIRDDILSLKMGKEMDDSSLVGNNVVSSAVSFEDSLVSELLSKYCQEDVGVPAY